MIELKAYVHANRIGAVIAAVKSSAAWAACAKDGPPNLAVYVVKGSLLPVSDSERHFSVELGEEVVNEYKLELLCHDEHADELVAIIRKTARTGQGIAGWVYLTPVQQSLPIV